MTEDEISKILMSTFVGLMSDSKYSYKSSRPEYSHLTDAGRNMMLMMIDMLAPKLAIALDEEIEDLAKKRMMENIKQ